MEADREGGGGDSERIYACEQEQEGPALMSDEMSRFKVGPFF